LEPQQGPSEPLEPEVQRVSPEPLKPPTLPLPELPSALAKPSGWRRELPKLPEPQELEPGLLVLLKPPELLESPSAKSSALAKLSAAQQELLEPREPGELQLALPEPPKPLELPESQPGLSEPLESSGSSEPQESSRTSAEPGQPAEPVTSARRP